jgi:hypothetical protein
MNLNDSANLSHCAGLFPKLWYIQIVLLYLCLVTRLPHQEEGPAAKKKTVLEEEETETPDLILNVVTVMSVIQAGGEEIKMTMVEPDTLIASGETVSS